MSGCALTICRGCCCGTDDRKQAAARLDYLRQRLHSMDLRTSDCLGPCDRKDVIVVHPHARHRKRGQGPIWLARMHTKTAMDELIGWLDAGGPGQVLMPVDLADNAFRPPARRKRSRRVG
jgi:hypothetical protein